jgi:hypothetical protein
MTESKPAASAKERDDLQHPIIHEGAPPESYDGNEGADELVEVVEPDGKVTPRVANEEGRSTGATSGTAS